MKANRCVFCLGIEDGNSCQFNCVEHIVPESLGGGKWSELEKGFVCDRCQNYFGAKVERAVLHEYPLSYIRTFSAIPTKKGKMPFLVDRLEGRFDACKDGCVAYTPAPHFEQALLEGRKTQTRLLAAPGHPERMCQFLLKMGLELLADRRDSSVFGKLFDPARRVARFLDASHSWFYIHHQYKKYEVKTSLLGVHRDPDTFCEISIFEHLGPPIVTFQILDHTFIAPLTTDFALDDPGTYGEIDTVVYEVRGASAGRYGQRP